MGLTDRLEYLRSENDRKFREWKKALWFVVPDGSVVRKPEGPESQTTEMFYEAVKLQLKDIVEQNLGAMRRLSKKIGLTAPDYKKIIRWKEGSLKFNSLSRRQTKLATLIKKQRKREDQLLAMYILLMPHTYCFAPFYEDRTLDEIVDKVQALTDFSQYIDAGSGWMQSDRIPIYKKGDHKVNLTAYLYQGNSKGRKKPRMKLKLYSKNKGESGVVDSLDVEALIQARDYVDIIHYDVEKNYTLQRIKEEKGVAIISQPDRYEISRSPDTDHVIVRYKRQGEKKVEHIDEAELNQNFTVPLWKKYPLAAGGTVLGAIIAAIRAEPKFEAMQYHFLNLSDHGK